MEISVVMPNYNHGRYLNKSIGALMNQKLKPTKIFIFDDASTDNSLDIIFKLQAKYKIIELTKNQTRKGVVQNCQEGLKKCTTKFIYFAAADDLVHANFFSKTVALLNAHEGSAVSSSNSNKIDEAGNSIISKEVSYTSHLAAYLSKEKVAQIYKSFGLFQNGNATIYRRQQLESFGGIPNLGPYSDSVIILLLSLKYGACFVPLNLASWRISDNSYSSSTSKNMRESLKLITKAQKFLKKNSDSFPINNLHLIWRNRAIYHLILKMIDEENLHQLEQLTKLHRYINILSNLGIFGKKLAKILMLLILDYQGFLSILKFKLFRIYE